MALQSTNTLNTTLYFDYTCWSFAQTYESSYC